MSVTGWPDRVVGVNKIACFFLISLSMLLSKHHLHRAGCQQQLPLPTQCAQSCHTMCLARFSPTRISMCWWPIWICIIANSVQDRSLCSCVVVQSRLSCVRCCQNFPTNECSAVLCRCKDSIFQSTHSTLTPLIDYAGVFAFRYLEQAH